MDDASIRRICEAELRKRGNPPNLDIDDLMQEYRLAELEKDEPHSRVAAMARNAVRDRKRCEVLSKMELHPDRETDIDENDTQAAEYSELEQEISEEVKAEMWAKASAALARLRLKCPQEAEAITMRYGLGCDPKSIDDIVQHFDITFDQAAELVRRGVERLQKMCKGLKVYLPLLGEEVEVVDEGRVNRRGKGQFRPQENRAVILGEAG